MHFFSNCVLEWWLGVSRSLWAVGTVASCDWLFSVAVTTNIAFTGYRLTSLVDSLQLTDVTAMH